MIRKGIALIVLLLLIAYVPITEAVYKQTTFKPGITNLSSEVYWIGVEYTFNITFKVPEGDIWLLEIDWGDGNITLLGPYESGDTVYFTHYWSEKGTYKIRIKIKTKYGPVEWFTFNIKVIPPNRIFKDIEISGMLKTRPWLGLIFSLINFDFATVSKGISRNVQLKPFKCHDYRFVALALNVHSFDKETLYIDASTPIAILIGY
jgi:hypothetical protein